MAGDEPRGGTALRLTPKNPAKVRFFIRETRPQLLKNTKKASNIPILASESQNRGGVGHACRVPLRASMGANIGTRRNEGRESCGRMVP